VGINNLKKLITIDGPAASGKGSLSRSLAQKRNWKWLSTGVFYRGLAYLSIEKKAKSEKEITELIHDEDWSVSLDEECTSFIHNGRNITQKIYNDKVDDVASYVARLPLVREYLLPYQRQCFEQNKQIGLVAEGRDCGTIVFPFAGLKIYLTAKDNIRAERRAIQRGFLSVDEVINSQKKRDEQDTNRLNSPLCKPEGAFIIDTGLYSFDEMVKKAYEKSRGLF